MTAFSMRWHPCAEDERITILELSGSMDIAIAEPFARGVDRLLTENRVFVIVDMEGVDFIGSPAVGMLMGLRRRLVERRGNLVLVGLAPALKEKLNLMGANRIFRYYSDIKTVLTDFRWEHDHMAQVVNLRLPANAAYVPALRRLFSSIAIQKGYNRKDAFRIETIVDELSNNAIEHGDPRQGHFFVDFSLDKEKVEITVRNQSGFSSEAEARRVREKIENPVVDDDSIRGRGLALVKMLSSELKLDIGEAGTTVKVIKVREE